MEQAPVQKSLALSLAALQMGALVALWWVADQAAHRLGLPVPGSVLGLAVLVGLLWSGLLPLAWVKAGADLLLAEMLLFFIPAVVAVVKYPALILQRGWTLLAVILLGTAAVMVGTAFAVEAAVRAQARWRR
jgi:holin-like protein